MSKDGNGKHQLDLAADIVEVYEDNFYEELTKMAEAAQQYNYIAMVSTSYFQYMDYND